MILDMECMSTMITFEWSVIRMPEHVPIEGSKLMARISTNLKQISILLLDLVRRVSVMPITEFKR